MTQGAVDGAIIPLCGDLVGQVSLWDPGARLSEGRSKEGRVGGRSGSGDEGTGPSRRRVRRGWV